MWQKNKILHISTTIAAEGLTEDQLHEILRQAHEAIIALPRTHDVCTSWHDVRLQNMHRRAQRAESRAIAAERREKGWVDEFKRPDQALQPGQAYYRVWGLGFDHALNTIRKADRATRLRYGVHDSPSLLTRLWAWLRG